MRYPPIIYTNINVAANGAYAEWSLKSGTERMVGTKPSKTKMTGDHRVSYERELEIFKMLLAKETNDLLFDKRDYLLGGTRPSEA